MELKTAAINTSIPLTHLFKASYSNGKISVPVSSSSVVYARFKHLTGVPSPAGSGGLPVNRLKQLDIMIDYINRLKNKNFSVDMEGADSEMLDRITEKYSEILREQVVSRLSEYQPGVYTPGSVLNMTA